MLMSNAKADAVRRFLRAESSADATLADDPDRVGRLVERVTRVIEKSEQGKVEPVAESLGVVARRLS